MSVVICTMVLMLACGLGLFTLALVLLVGAAGLVFLDTSSSGGMGATSPQIKKPTLVGKLKFVFYGIWCVSWVAF